MDSRTQLFVGTERDTDLFGSCGVLFVFVVVNKLRKSDGERVSG